MTGQTALVLSVLSVLLFTANGAGNIFENAEEGAKLVTATSKFALRLYKEQAAAGTGNVFMSPISISIAMAMTYLGARGETMSQMKDGMFFGDVKEADLHQAFSDVRKALNSSNHRYKLLLANRLFGEKSYDFEADYLTSSEKFYGAQLASVNFMRNSSLTAQLINNWIAENTDQKIKHILSENDVDPLTKMILVNAIYFQAHWLYQFDKLKTTKQNFYVRANESIKVPLMVLSSVRVKHGINERLNCQAIELPYVNKTFSMFIILPDVTVTDIHAVERSLTEKDLINITTSFGMYSNKVNIWLPRFKIDEKLELNKLLANLGIVDLFSESKADLSGISKSGRLFVSKVIHEAHLEVDEEGSRATAATVVVMLGRSMSDKVADFRADHPFIFFIRDNINKSVLFLGRLMKP